ncbi:MBG domain-containing protein, partial [Escherichia coli]|uniref:MBG domain-containing protein n=1 Tax=Escherichia coli TaxID=562 RepID=UPI0013D6AF14
NYAITLGTLGNGNYAVAYAGANLAVTQRTITVTADPLSRTYGDANPALTWQITAGSLVNNDSLTGSLATSATGTSNVGSYAI